MGDMRCFLAFDLPDGLLQHLAGIQSHFKKEYPYLRWVRRENLHLTLHFLGNTSREILDQIVAECRPLVRRNTVFPVRAGELGVFPRWKEPSVLWLSLTGEMETLNRLQYQTAGIIKRTGLKLDSRPFLPHITLARVPAARKQGLDPAKFKNYTMGNQQEYLLSSFTLYVSELRPQGPVYKPYFRFDLNKE